MASIADLYLAKGNAEAAAILQRGNIYADLIRNLSSVPGQIIQNQRANQQEELKRQLVQSQVATAAGEQQLTAQRVAAGQQQQQNADVLKSALNDPSIYNPDGTFNKAGLRDKLTASGNLHLLPQLNEMSDHLDASAASAEEKQNALVTFKREEMGKDAQQIEAAGNDAGLFHQAVIQRAKLGWIPQDQANAYLQLSTPDQVASVTKQWKAGTKAGAPNLRDVKEGDTVLDVNTNKPVFTAPSKPPTPSAAGFAAIANDTSKTPAERAAASQSLSDLQKSPGEQETARHNAEMERIDTLRVGKQSAAELETARHNKAMESRASDDNKLIRVEHKDPTTGKTVLEWLPQSQVRGQTFEKGTSAAIGNRLASAEAVTQTGNDIIAKLSDPAFAKNVGPAMGRFSSVKDFIGNPPPEYSELAGEIDSFALANMGVHGMRSVEGAKMIQKLLDQKHTPESLAAAIKGLNQFSTRFMQNQGVTAPAATPSTGKTGTVGKYTYTVD